MKTHALGRSILVCAFVFAASLFSNLNILAGESTEDKKLWQRSDLARVGPLGERRLSPEKAEIFRLDPSVLSDNMREMPLEFTNEARLRQVIIEIPMPDGTLQRFRIEDSPVLADHLAADVPGWRTFQGYGIDDPTATARFDWTIKGFHGYILTDRGTVYIDPLQENDTENYLVYFKHEYGRSDAGEFKCGVDDLITKLAPIGYSEQPDAINYSYGGSIRTYRLAVATTGEWSRGTTMSIDPITVRTAALAALTTSVNRLDGIFRTEIGSSFQLVNPSINNNATNIIFDDPATDPYDNTDGIPQLTINQNTIDARVGVPNYDLGHLYGTGGGGVASTPSMCDVDKAQGYSARAGFYGDPFTVDYVAHEIGHQFGGNHTYNNADNAGGACTTRSALNAFEVASGSTIMSYVGICNIRNQQQYVDTGRPAFHIRSLTEMTNYITSPTGTCGSAPAATNSIPTVNAGASFTIPRLTPFTLTATANDADAGDVPNLLYSWEQYDLSPSGSGQQGLPALTYDVDTDGVPRPLFRNYAPVSSPSRTFPSLNFILNPANNNPAGSNNPALEYNGTHPTGAPGAVCQVGQQCVIGESLPSIARTMNFRVSVRDRRGGIVDAGTTVTTVTGTGPFQVTVQNTAPTAWTGGSTQTVTWDVAGSAAAPINAANVNIRLSTDGGLTFPTMILANTPNDGTQAITVPNTPTTTARIRVEAVGNIFFDINNTNFTITAGANTPPSASTVVANVTTAGATSHTITTTYTDDTGINVATLGGANHDITGPNNFGATAPFISVNINTNGTPRVATYSLTPPGGSWDAGDNGTYTVLMRANQVADVDGAFVPGGQLATFTVNIPGGATPTPTPTPAVTPTPTPTPVVTPTPTPTPVVTPTPTPTPVVTPSPSPTPTGNRTITLGNAAGNPGQQVVVPVIINSQGNESSVSFSVNVNPAILTNPVVALGNGVPSGANLGTNLSEAAAGRIGVLVDATNSYAAGARQIITITFTIAGNAQIGLTPVTFGTVPTGQSVSSSTGALLAATFQNGTVQVGSTAAGVTISGRVLTSDGRGLRNAQVTITGPDGFARTVTTSSFGFYRFEDVESGQAYVVGVSTKRYRFTPRLLQVIDSITDVDFVGLE